MASTIVEIDARQITSWSSFHDVFAKAMGFPDFYGRNMNAWIDCMTSLDEPEDGLTSVHVPRGGVLALHIDHMGNLANRCPEIYDAIVECSAFVNYRRIVVAEEPVLALSCFRQQPAYRRPTSQEDG